MTNLSEAIEDLRTELEEAEIENDRILLDKGEIRIRLSPGSGRILAENGKEYGWGDSINGAMAALRGIATAAQPETLEEASGIEQPEGSKE